MASERLPVSSVGPVRLMSEAYFALQRLKNRHDWDDATAVGIALQLADIVDLELSQGNRVVVAVDGRLVELTVEYLPAT